MVVPGYAGMQIMENYAGDTNLMEKIVFIWQMALCVAEPWMQLYYLIGIRNGCQKNIPTSIVVLYWIATVIMLFFSIGLIAAILYSAYSELPDYLESRKRLKLFKADVIRIFDLFHNRDPGAKAEFYRIMRTVVDSKRFKYFEPLFYYYLHEHLSRRFTPKCSIPHWCKYCEEVFTPQDKIIFTMDKDVPLGHIQCMHSGQIGFFSQNPVEEICNLNRLIGSRISAGQNEDDRAWDIVLSEWETNIFRVDIIS